jgi:hypothetical protein
MGNYLNCLIVGLCIEVSSDSCCVIQSLGRSEKAVERLKSCSGHALYFPLTVGVVAIGTRKRRRGEGQECE